MKPYQIYIGIHIAILLISKIFKIEDHDDVESEEENIPARARVS